MSDPGPKGHEDTNVCNASVALPSAQSHQLCVLISSEPLICDKTLGKVRLSLGVSSSSSVRHQDWLDSIETCPGPVA